MNTVYIHNKTGFDSSDKVVFIVNGREYRWQHADRQAIEIPDGMRMVQMQIRYQRFSSPVYNFDLKDGIVFTARCHPLIGFNADANLKLTLSLYLLLLVVAAYMGYYRVTATLLVIAAVLLAFFLTAGRDNFFIIKQERISYR
jgi:hypothetical protein